MDTVKKREKNEEKLREKRNIEKGNKVEYMTGK